MGAGLQGWARFILITTCLPLFASIGYTEEPVQFADSKLKEAVENALNKEILTPADMEQLFWLPHWFQWETLGISDIRQLSGLEHAVNLDALGIQDSSINDFSVLSQLEELRKLMLASCGIADLSALVPVIRNLEKLEDLSLKDNHISDISLFVDFKGLKTLNLQKNPLNEQAYKVYIPQIRKNNPGIKIAMAFRPTQLIAPAIVFAVFIILALVFICRSRSPKGWLFELVAGILAAVIGCYLGLGAQFLYVYPIVA